MIRSNKPGTAQVVFISKAQKYSRINNWKNLEKFFFKKKGIWKKMSHSAEKNAKGGPFGLPSTFGSIKNCGLVRDSNTRSPASKTPENPG